MGGIAPKLLALMLMQFFQRRFFCRLLGRQQTPHGV